MITKISKPSKSGKVVYDNKGSVARLVNYLAHEAKPLGKEVTYFNQTRSDITAQEVVQRIDGNQKGLRKEDAKFYSLIISPSAEELGHIGNDPAKLKAYTRQVMEPYAQNFKLKDGRELKSEDLVWYATFHQGREYNGFDKAVREGGVKAGAAKPGLQTHIHVVVSRRDVSQKISLTPTGRKERFSIQDWQKQNAESFKLMFGYQKQTYFDKSANKEQNLRTRLEKFAKANGLTPSYFDTERVVKLAKEQGFNWKFYRNLREVEYTLKQGVRPPNPYGQLFSPSGKSDTKKESLRQVPPLVNRTSAKAQAVEQSQPISDGKAGKQTAGLEAKAEKQPLEHQVQRGQLVQFFSKMAHAATITGREESWGYQPKKPKSRNRQREADNGLSR
jgi:hypothetical protein